MGDMARYDCYIKCSDTMKLIFNELEMVDVLNLLHIIQNAMIHEKYRDNDRDVEMIISLHKSSNTNGEI